MEQIRDLRVGDIILYKNKESRIITDIDHRGKAYLLRTTDLNHVSIPTTPSIRSTSGARRRPYSDAD